MNIPFNKPFFTGKEVEYILQSVNSGKISGNGIFTQMCHSFFQEDYGFSKSLLTSSCTDALEMAAILADIQPGDEVIMPSYTFVSTANAFMLRGAKIVFADSNIDNPNVDVDALEALITSRTKVIVPVHYAGIACDMDKIIRLAKQKHLLVIEDAAQAIDSYYIWGDGQKQRLGAIGQLSAFSFHETKNIISGEGGLLAINDSSFAGRAEIIWEKGTNRSALQRGEVNKYGWVDIGSSYLPSDIIAAFLYAQLENIKDIQDRRKVLWQTYHDELKSLEELGIIKLPFIPYFATNNAHMFYILCPSAKFRTDLIQFLKKMGVMAVFHYLSLHKSPYFKDKHDGRELANCEYFTDVLLRLPLYYELSKADILKICLAIRKFIDGYSS